MARNDLEIKKGNDAEESFKKLFTFVKRATKEQDILEHWDVKTVDLMHIKYLSVKKV